MRRLHRVRLGIAALALAGCAPDGPRVDVGAYETETFQISYVFPDSRYGAGATLLEVSGDDLPEAIRQARQVVRDSVDRFLLALAPEAVPDSVDTDFVSVSGQTDRLFVSDDVYSTLVTLVVGSGGSDGATVYLPVTVDLDSGEAVRLGDLFAPGTRWREALASAVRTATLAAVPGAEAAQVPTGFEALVGDDPAFTLGPEALALHIPPRALTSAALHPEVAYTALTRHARQGGVLDRLGGGHPNDRAQRQD
ncbi:MAG: hypothetical protein AAF845_20045 [Bacteroidota bacterium]